MVVVASGRLVQVADGFADPVTLGYILVRVGVFFFSIPVNWVVNVVVLCSFLFVCRCVWVCVKLHSVIVEKVIKFYVKRLLGAKADIETCFKMFVRTKFMMNAGFEAMIKIKN